MDRQWIVLDACAKTALIPPLFHPQEVYPQLVETVDKAGDIVMISHPLALPDVKFMQFMQNRQAGISGPGNEYIMEVRFIHRGVDKSAVFPQFILWQKGRKIAGLRHFSTASTAPITTTKYIIQLSMLMERMIPCNLP